MPHNPRLGRNKLPRNPFASRADIPIGSVGVLYDGGRFVRLLSPDQQPSMIEHILGTLTFYVVDIGPHSATWDVRLPSRGDRDFFPVSINLNYQVDDPRRMVEERIEDTEDLIARALEPILRKQGRRFALNEYEELLPLLEASITADLFGSLGLRLNRPADVTIRLDVEAHERIKQLNELERATRVSQQQLHQVKLPSKEPIYNFEARVTLTYRVMAIDQLPTDTLVEAEALLWPQVETALRKASRQFPVDQVFEAEQQMQTVVDSGSFKGHGLEVLAVQVAIDLGEDARKRAQELAQLAHEEKVAKLRDEADALQQKRRLRMREDALTFYRPLIEGGRKELLVHMLSDNPEDARQILSYLDERERDELKLKLELLQVMADKGGLWEEPAEQAAQALLDSLMALVKRQPALQPSQEQRQLSDGQQSPPDAPSGTDIGEAPGGVGSSATDNAGKGNNGTKQSRELDERGYESG